jgi:hypothetical protein
MSLTPQQRTCKERGREREERERTRYGHCIDHDNNKIKIIMHTAAYRNRIPIKRIPLNFTLFIGS